MSRQTDGGTAGTAADRPSAADRDRSGPAERTEAVAGSDRDWGRGAFSPVEHVRMEQACGVDAPEPRDTAEYAKFSAQQEKQSDFRDLVRSASETPSLVGMMCDTIRKSEAGLENSSSVVRAMCDFEAQRQATMRDLAAPVEGLGVFAMNWSEMTVRQMQGTDKFFHCMANCDTAKLGPRGAEVARQLSDLREWSDQLRKGDSQLSVDCDQFANSVGRDAARAGVRCVDACRPFIGFFEGRRRR